MRRRWTAALLLVAASCGPGAEAPPELPDVVAAIGDSITRAANPSPSMLGDNPEHSWVTGKDAEDGVTSHVERIAARGEAPAVHNLAVSGARMAGAPAQAARAVETGADYVTILMGANDVCASSPERMTPLDDFEASLRETMDTIADGLPESRVYVVSIPEVHRLWTVLRDSVVARTVWRTFGICGAMLAEGNTDADREAVRERNMAFNRVLREVCATYERCLDDGGAVFEDDFDRDAVSSADHFHPSLEGQAALAEVSWSAGYWPDV